MYLPSPFTPSGTVGYSGAPSTVEGHRFAFGCTEETLRRDNLIIPAKGADGDPWHNRATGVGRVRASSGDYADALTKKHDFTLAIIEITGGMNLGLYRLLARWQHAGSLPRTADNTVYGSARSAPRSFLRHHAAAIVHALLRARSESILADASRRHELLTQLAPGSV